MTIAAVIDLAAYRTRRAPLASLFMDGAAGAVLAADPCSPEARYFETVLAVSGLPRDGVRELGALAASEGIGSVAELLAHGAEPLSALVHALRGETLRAVAEH